MKKYIKLEIFIGTIAFIVAMAFLIKINSPHLENGRKILNSISDQLNFGARNVGTVGHIKTQQYIIDHLTTSNIEVVSQDWADSSGQPLKNIIGRLNPQAQKRIILATHYDTHSMADLDKTNPNGIMPGANDGASGVATLLILGEEIKNSARLQDVGVDLVFFDAEEFEPGDFENWNPKGSTYFAQNLDRLYPNTRPYLAIDIDMVCDADLRFLKSPNIEGLSIADQDKLWAEGRNINMNVFLGKNSTEIKDDNTALMRAGVPSILLIDLNYPYFHTTKDTIDKCSPSSLEVVFVTLKNYLLNSIK